MRLSQDLLCVGTADDCKFLLSLHLILPWSNRTYRFECHGRSGTFCYDYNNH